jgi:hypothetical protein
VAKEAVPLLAKDEVGGAYIYSIDKLCKRRRRSGGGGGGEVGSVSDVSDVSRSEEVGDDVSDATGSIPIRDHCSSINQIIRSNYLVRSNDRIEANINVSIVTSSHDAAVEVDGDGLLEVEVEVDDDDESLSILVLFDGHDDSSNMKTSLILVLDFFPLSNLNDVTFNMSSNYITMVLPSPLCNPTPSSHVLLSC